DVREGLVDIEDLSAGRPCYLGEAPNIRADNAERSDISASQKRGDGARGIIRGAVAVLAIVMIWCIADKDDAHVSDRPELHFLHRRGQRFQCILLLVASASRVNVLHPSLEPLRIFSRLVALRDVVVEGNKAKTEIDTLCLKPR